MASEQAFDSALYGSFSYVRGSLHMLTECLRDLLRRLNPKDTSKNVELLCELAPALQEDLLESVDVPLPVKVCRKTKREFLCCDYNRDGDSWRSPWSNEFEPPLPDGEGVVPSDRVRKMEIRANEAFDVYRELYVTNPCAGIEVDQTLECRYYEGGISSVYFWDIDDGFAGCVLLKKCK
jgi:capping protein (actin filament) muscle Z-line, beta